MCIDRPQHKFVIHLSYSSRYGAINESDVEIVIDLGNLSKALILLVSLTCSVYLFP